jgi:hypothetical protein
MTCNCNRIDRDCQKCRDQVEWCSFENEMHNRVEEITSLIDEFKELIPKINKSDANRKARKKYGNSPRKPYWYKKSQWTRINNINSNAP